MRINVRVTREENVGGGRLVGGRVEERRGLRFREGMVGARS